MTYCFVLCNLFMHLRSGPGPAPPRRPGGPPHRAGGGPSRPGPRPPNGRGVLPSWHRPSGDDISKLGGKVMEVMVVMNWEVMNSCSNGSNEEVIALQNDHVVMKMAHGVMM